MTEIERLARFAANSRFEHLSTPARVQLKLRVLDSLGVAIGALDTPPMPAIRAMIDDLGGRPVSTLIGGGASAPDRAAFYNGALVRALDFMDSTLAPGETFHPSDNLGAVLAAAEAGDGTGEDFLAGLAVAYEVQTRLSDAAPVRRRGFDHTTQGAYACAAGVARALCLGTERTAHACAIAGASNVALRVTRTGRLSNWKGLAYPNTAFSATHAALLAMHGITGPLEVLEGNKGFKESVAGPFDIRWDGLEAVMRSIIKRYDAEVHAQSAIEGALELRECHGITVGKIERVEIDTFQAAYDIIGGGEEGDKKRIETREDADHSLPYLVAVALLDGEVLPAQFTRARIAATDVRVLIEKISVRPDAELTRRFPAELPARLKIVLADGSEYKIEKCDYEGFFTRPMSREAVIAKFTRLASPYADAALRREIIQTIDSLENLRAREFTATLARVRAPRPLKIAR
jgi:2-methylcitrate dehydratase